MSLSSTCNGITISNDCNIIEQRNVFKQYNAEEVLSAVVVVLETKGWKWMYGNGNTEKEYGSEKKSCLSLSSALLNHDSAL